ncbi:4-(cytidine 5'-diphospho)-2-C-methyl-D-erythritol kinase [Chelatococcus sp. SYSU_G07232]|uniref:4-diphosphocytidyl-2-C-methyl-D-erythritol kinase n=1 Tax=Chelatococcus albus TaxID=3047466 RepID=A0ABT7AEN3_9HYPH|nr:4-(cytidine 5'-diphospho)-2-C-methyl-D-erythritol kinase [Chelatococcus sp. SYSU_G07232]MDJ1157816.1 4-(cytidine 5'-diphospho)-2-C-methyl-D-erythritol kinase [Chelatococcus sp. SYSU_G07232]
MLIERAPAKVNLTLHVLGRRTDGYHELDSLVAFAGCADRVTLATGDSLSLVVDGPMAQAAGAGGENLVLKAARAFAERFPGAKLGAFHLLKRLPVAAGIGGGSADAAAALRLIARANGIASDHPAILAAARATGADVPVCLASRARRMGGAGENLGPPLALPPLFAVLVNPGVAVETAAVFRALGLSHGEMARGASHPALPIAGGPDRVITALAAARNDLEVPAMRLAPAIGEALSAVRAVPGCRLARMSGSGATVFGLFDDCRAAAQARRAILARHPRWWVRGTALR